MYARVAHDHQLALSNAGFKPDALCGYERLRVLERTFHHVDDKLAALSALEPAHLTRHVGAAMEGGVGVSFYAGGNFDATDAIRMYEKARSALGSPPPLSDERAAVAAARAACIQLPRSPAGSVWVVANKNNADDNCAVEAYWQLELYSEVASARLFLLETMMYEPLFNQLRTKQQMGYSVGCSGRSTHATLGLLIHVTSASHSPKEIEDAILQFVHGFLEQLESMPPDEYARQVRQLSRRAPQPLLFPRHGYVLLCSRCLATPMSQVESAITCKLQDDNSMLDEASRFFSEIETRQFIFDRAEREAAALRATTREDLAQWARDRLVGSSARRLSVHVLKGGEAVTNAASITGLVPIGEVGLDVFKAKLEAVPDPVRPWPKVEAPF
eukprot:scaffold274513_cov33-Tisochrysis_lutea.AAC.7